MPIEEMLDNITHTFLNIVKYVVSNTSKLLIPYTLSTYAFLLDTGIRIKKQSYITMKAVLQSFQSEMILFYSYGNAYVPVLSNSSKSHGSFSWLYSAETSTFYNSSFDTKHPSLHNLPMLGAGLCYILEQSDSATSIGDLSEWIADQKVHSNSADVPLQVLVSAWSYYTAKTMYYNYKNYILIITDMEGNETAYNLETGATVCIPTIQTANSIENNETLNTNNTIYNESKSEEKNESNQQKDIE